jgi:hypothetical protein
MAYTVRLVEEPSGWFATLRSPWPLGPEARVRWESVFEVEAHAVSVLGLADLLARRLTEGTCTWRETDEGLAANAPRPGSGGAG